MMLMLFHSKILDYHFLRLAQRRYRKALLGDNLMFFSVLFLFVESWKLLLL
jgi:hypothetical protein